MLLLLIAFLSLGLPACFASCPSYIFLHPTDPHKFYKFQQGFGYLKFDCPAGLVFSPQDCVCVRDACSVLKDGSIWRPTVTDKSSKLTCYAHFKCASSKSTYAFCASGNSFEQKWGCMSESTCTYSGQPEFHETVKIFRGDGENVGCGKCGQNAKCINNKCVCEDGFDGDGYTCKVNGCKRCHADATCINNRCVCNYGFIGDGTNCGVDGCKRCHADATCQNNRCVCNYGFTGDGTNCQVDGCKKCHANAVCKGNRCVCNYGFIGDGTYCQAMANNKCAYNGHVCDSNAECVKEGTSYKCKCKGGFIGNGYKCIENPCITKSDGYSFTIHYLTKCYEYYYCHKSKAYYFRCPNGYRFDVKNHCVLDYTCRH
ncbi:tenascin-like [Gigantopelta aegis]|uniref:tenascin-like n=1 Tax=Gigantopelta aegis TaxID=1735272 RepID=UPI001B888BE4|nr:tenascin-like [Gigantopelta aegis]